MPDRTTTEEQLDHWLDALNESGAIPPPPAAISDLAEVALDYRRALAPNDTAAATPERNGTMHHVDALTSSNGATWRILSRPERRQVGWGSWLATAAVFALLIGLVGGAAVRRWGLPVGDDPSHLAGIAASPAATPAAGTLSCAAPGYRAVVEVDDVPADPALPGGAPIVRTGGGYTIPGDVSPLGTVGSTTTAIGYGFLLERHDDGSATAKRIRDGETWSFPALNTSWVASGEAFVRLPLPYLVGAVNEEGTNWLILDLRTGNTTTTREILGRDDVAYSNPMATSHFGDGVMLLRFSPVVIDGPDATAVPRHEFPEGDVFSLFLPGALDRAREVNVAGGFVASSDGKWYATDTTLFNAETGERAGNLYPEISKAGDVIGFLDENAPILLVLHRDTIYRINPLTGETRDLYTADAPVQRVLFDPETSNLLIGTNPDAGIVNRWLDPATSETREMVELADLRLQMTSPAIFPIGMRGDTKIDQIPSTPVFGVPVDDDADSGSVVVVDMATGSALTHISEVELARYGNGSAIATYRSWEQQGRIVTGLTGHRFMVSDPMTRQNILFELPAGTTLEEGWSARYQLSPDGHCVSLRVVDENGASVGVNYIAPLEPDAEWQPLDSAIVDWWQINVAPEEPQTLPAQDFASPAATPAAGTLSCASPGYIPVVRGEADPDALARIGATDAILRGDTTTIIAANGAEITLGPDEQWTVFPSSNVILSGDKDDDDLPTVTSLATGHSWTFPTTTDQVGSLSGSYLMVGPWLFGPTDVTATDWRVINTETGEERLTSDIFGAPFAGTSQVQVSGPWGAVTDGPLLVDFMRVGTRSPGMVLPSTDLDDAWAIGEEHAEAGFNGMITSDGALLAYLHLAESGDAVVRVLDGFSGELLAERLAPAAGGDFLQPVGLTADDGKMILRDSQRVWTVDLATGEIATVFDPGGLIHSFEFDPTTGTGRAPAGADNVCGVDPATPATTALGRPRPRGSPQPQLGWALIQSRDDIAVDYALLDMATGEIAAGPVGADRDENGTNAWITGGDETGVYVIQAESGRMLVLDGPGRQAFAMSVPESGRDGWNGVSIGVSPNGACLVYTEVGQGEEPGTSWIAPLDPDAEWIELDFELGSWIEMPPAPPVPMASPGAVHATPSLSRGVGVSNSDVRCLIR